MSNKGIINKILVIQTAFIGDVILATSLLEKLYKHYPDSQIDVLVRKGNESLLKGHPFVNKVLVWNKKQNKISNLLKISKEIRNQKYDLLINLQRFFSSGFIAARSKAKEIRGFKKNPLSLFFSKAFKHEISTDKNSPHEIYRNHQLIADLTDAKAEKPKLYPSQAAFEKTKIEESYITIAPSSVWYTKQLPSKNWILLMNKIPMDTKIFLLGAPTDKTFCEDLASKSDHPNIVVKASELSLLESAALMSRAKMNYVNDSAPLHLASAMNAPVTAFFCSTVPSFGFGPLSDIQEIKQIEQPLACRPCGITGKKECPLGHFNCSKIEM